MSGNKEVEASNLELVREEPIQCESLGASRKLVDEYEIMGAEIANDLAEITPVVHIFVLDLAEELIMNVLGTGPEHGDKIRVVVFVTKRCAFS